VTEHIDAGQAGCARLVLRPVIRDEAVAFIRQHHRHAKRSLPGWKFGAGIFTLGLSGHLVGVGVAGRPSSRAWDQRGGGEWIEVTRVCTTGDQNGCSQLYGALTRAAKALGYCTAWTYTLDRESGASLKASGWVIDAELPVRAGWDCASRPRHQEMTEAERQAEGSASPRGGTGGSRRRISLRP
jgi:hypothetical protein